MNIENSFLKVAVTGGAGSGKTFVCSCFEKLGAKVISSDMLARETVVPGTSAYGKIVGYFGEKILKNDGFLNRKMLRRIIVNDDKARSILEGFVHPEIIELMQQEMAKAKKLGFHVVVVEVPLLFELELEENFDIVILVTIDKDLQVKRMMDRDAISCDDANALLNVQMSDKERAKRTEYIIENSGSMEQTMRSVELIYKKIYSKTLK